MSGTAEVSVPEFFAVPDPHDPSRMTYWRKVHGTPVPWPPKARYYPSPLRSEVPTVPAERAAWVQRWFAEVGAPWGKAVMDAIEADPRGCAARFAAFRTRCCACGRTLRDSASKTYGVGPECRSGWPDGLLAAMATAVGLAHAATRSGDENFAGRKYPPNG